MTLGVGVMTSVHDVSVEIINHFAFESAFFTVRRSREVGVRLEKLRHLNFDIQFFLGVALKSVDAEDKDRGRLIQGRIRHELLSFIAYIAI